MIIFKHFTNTSVVDYRKLEIVVHAMGVASSVSLSRNGKGYVAQKDWVLFTVMHYHQSCLSCNTVMFKLKVTNLFGIQTVWKKNA